VDRRLSATAGRTCGDLAEGRRCGTAYPIHGGVEAWLVTVVTRLSIDRLRQVKAERESYVGPWLPEPLVSAEAPPADAESELASSLSVAFLVVLERLAPEERAARS
jgi:DNA-directed RNA polymerase specialized sigma24 family protein